MLRFLKLLLIAPFAILFLVFAFANRYFIVVSALDVSDAGVPATATPALVLFQTLAHIIARAMLVPVYGA